MHDSFPFSADVKRSGRQAGDHLSLMLKCSEMELRVSGMHCGLEGFRDDGLRLMGCLTLVVILTFQGHTQEVRTIAPTLRNSSLLPVKK